MQLPKISLVIAEKKLAVEMERLSGLYRDNQNDLPKERETLTKTGSLDPPLKGRDCASTLFRRLGIGYDFSFSVIVGC